MAVTLEDVAWRLLPKVPMGRALARREWLTLVASADVLLLGTSHGVSSERAADNVEKFLILGQSRRAWRVRVLLELVEALPLSTHGRPFSALSREERRTIIETKWIHGHRIWRLCGKTRNLVLLGAYGDARAEATTGYIPVPKRARFKHLTLANQADAANQANGAS